MKILFLTPWYPDEKNQNHGIFVREQAVALSSHHEVVVISSKVSYIKFGFRKFGLMESEFLNVKEYRLVINHSLPIYNQLNYFLISVKVATKIAREWRPDVIHGNIGYPGGFWSWWVSKKVNKPFIITEHTFIYNNFRSFIHKKLTLFALRRAAAVVTVSTSAANEMKKYIEGQVLVVPNIVDVTRYSIAPYRDTPIAIGFLGGLSSPNHVKGLDSLMNVLSTIKGDFVLHIGGSGVMEERYKEMAKKLGILEKCIFFGFIPYEDVPKFMNRLHFFVSPSRFESFGIAIVEAMASGLPVVCFDNGGPSDFVNSTNGILVEDQNKERLYDATGWMMENYQRFNREKIRISVASKFSKNSFVDAMDAVYKSVLLTN